MARTRYIPLRKARLAAVGLTVAVCAAVVSFTLLTGTRTGDALEFRALDARFTSAPERAMPRNIVVVGIDNNTDTALHERYPYPRRTFADAIDQLTAAGAAAVVIDVQFLEPTTPRDDAALVAAISRSGRVVLATAPEHQSTGAEITPLPLQGIQLADGSDALEASGAQVAIAEPEGTPDGIIRWISPLQRTRLADGTSQTFPALALAAQSVADGTSPFARRDLPHRLMIDWHGPTALAATTPAERHNRVALHNFADLVTADAPPTWARGAIVLIGSTSPVMHDLHETPMRVSGATGGDASLMPGVEIHAQAIATLAEHTVITRQSLRDAGITLAALVLIIWGACTFLPILAGIAISLASVTAWSWFAVRSFSHARSELLIAPVAGSAMFALIALVATLSAAAWLDRRRVARLFARYVAPDVVEELLTMRDGIELQGEYREVSVLFADIRGFTAMSEHRDPARLVEELNEYFEVMAGAIERHNGMIDKFIGDGLMAVFGAPLPRDDHATLACACARDMCDAIDELNRMRTDRGAAPLDIGIGVHTGVAVVGNIGSPSRRVDYTVIGDTVNLASRLEGATKTLGVRVLASRQTCDLVSDKTWFGANETIAIRGRLEPCEVFEVVVGAERLKVRDSSADTDGNGDSPAGTTRAA